MKMVRIVDISPSPGSSLNKEIHVVTGGGGYAGFALGKYLAKKGHNVRLVDVREPVWDLEDGLEFFKVILFVS